MKFRIQVNPRERAPVLYGHSYRDINRFSITCHIIPFNWIIGLAREIYLKLRRGYTGTIERVYADGYRKGCEHTRRWHIKYPDRSQSLKSLKDIIQELKSLDNH